MQKKKILYISDNLGLSISHHRGISNYSLAMVKMLRNLDMDLTLLVERVDGYGLCDRAPKVDGKFSKIINSSEIAEIYRYFQEKTFDFVWELRPVAFRFANPEPSLRNKFHKGGRHNIEHDDLEHKKNKRRGRSEGKPEKNTRLVSRAIYENMNRRAELLTNSENIQDIYPQRGLHLKQFQGFLWMDYVYSDAPGFCLNDIAPVKVDASGFDYVFVDSPHYIMPQGIDPKHVFNVIHDIIPVTDTSWSWDWRTLFMQKIKTCAASTGNYIFVSEFTKNEFLKVFGDLCQNARSEIIFPTISEDIIARSNDVKKNGHSDYVVGISGDKPEEKIRNIKDRLRRAQLAASESLPVKKKKAVQKELSIDEKSPEFQRELKQFGDWNGSLPYVCSILADEERKNIEAIINVSKEFRGKLNFVLMGNINGNKYFGMEPEKYPNVHFSGFVSERQKDDILQGSLGFVFPCFAEGFGIPIIEAGLFNTPVVCADIPVFHEIVGDKAIYFDPHSVESFAAALNDLMKNTNRHLAQAKALRPTLIERFSEKPMMERLKDYVG